MAALLIVLLCSLVVSVQARRDTSPSQPAVPDCNESQSQPQSLLRSQSLSPSFLERLRPPREGELMLLRDQMLQGETMLKERLTSQFAQAREELKAGDARLKEQLVNGDVLLKEELQEGDSRLKEEVSRVEDLVRERLTREEARVKERLSEGEERAKEEQKEMRESMKQLQDFVKEWARRNDAVVAEQADDMSDLKSRLQLSDSRLQETQAKLRETQTKLDSTLRALQTQQTELETLRESRERIEEAESRITSLTVALESARETQESSKQGGKMQQDSSLVDEGFYQGSTFVRWGRTDCPLNTTIVYSGVVGGSSHSHTGAAAHPICMVNEPEQDPAFSLPATHTYIYGAEYEHVHGHHEQDVPCSVCRAPHATTVTVPATRKCPSGWAPQYSGFIMAGHHTHSAATAFLCVDKDMEDIQGGHENKNGFLLYYVAAGCGSLPCPPYTNNQAVLCVVCSL